MPALKFESPQDVYSSFNILLALRYMFGMKTIEKIKNSYARSKLQIVICVVCLAIFAITYFLEPADAKTTEISSIYEKCFTVYDIGMIIRCVIIYILCVKNGAHEAEAYRLVDSFDCELKKIGKSKDLLSDYKYIRQKSIFILIGAFIIQTILEILMELVSYNYYSIPIIINRFILQTVGNLSKCYFYLWICTICDRYKIINDYLNNIKNQLKHKKKVVVSIYKFEKDISQIIDIHKDLTAIARHINGMFQIQIVWHFLLMFLIVFANNYYSFYMFTKRQEWEPAFWFALIKGNLFATFEFYVLIRSCNQLILESAKTKEILCYMKIDIYDDISHRLVIASIYELNENKLSISACRLFEINYSTMFVMFTTISNYIFIMNQLDETGTKSNSTESPFPNYTMWTNEAALTTVSNY